MANQNNPYYVDESNPWFSEEAGWPDDVSRNMEFPELTLGDILRQSVVKYPDNRAIWFLDREMSYRELDEYVDRMATALHKLGLKKGDVMALILPNSFQYVVSYYACMRLGLIVSGVNPTYKPVEVLHQLKMIDAKACIVLDILYKECLHPIIGQSSIEHLIATNITDLLKLSATKKFIGRLLGKIPSGRVPSYALRFMDLLKCDIDLPEVEINAHDIATYIMTGGTTGVPKAAVLSHFNCVSNSMQGEAWLARDPEETSTGCNIGVLPFFHSFAMTCVMNASLLTGAWMMLFPRPPETRELLEKVAKYGMDEGTFYSGAEILFQNIAELPGIEKMDITKKFELCVSGAGPLHRHVQKAFEERTGAQLVEGYGLTEASPVVSANPFWKNRTLGSVGLPFPGTEWKIMDADEFGKEKEMCPLGSEPDQERHVGELCVAGPQVMVGYFNKPEETAKTIIEKDGKRWLLTGDIGYMDELGRVFLRDRKKQLIKYKGYSIYPKEIEELLGNHEGILEVAVAAIPDEVTGERIKAWVVLHDEWKNKISEDELQLWCRENMTHYKVPSYIQFMDAVPKSLIGKVMRRELQENDPLYQEHYKKAGS